MSGADDEAQTFVGVDYVKEMTVKKSCRCGEYGSFEFLFSVCRLLLVFTFSVRTAPLQCAADAASEILCHTAGRPNDFDLAFQPTCIPDFPA